MKIIYDLLAQIITFQLLLFFCKEKKMRNYDRVSGYIQAHEMLRGKGKGKELVVSRATRVKSQVGLCIETFTNRLTNGSHGIFLDKTVPTFFSCLVHSLYGRVIIESFMIDYHSSLPSLFFLPR